MGFILKWVDCNVRFYDPGWALLIIYIASLLLDVKVKTDNQAIVSCDYFENSRYNILLTKIPLPWFQFLSVVLAEMLMFLELSSLMSQRKLDISEGISLNYEIRQLAKISHWVDVYLKLRKLCLGLLRLESFFTQNKWHLFKK